MAHTADVPVAGSFRDPSGFVFRRDGVLYRQVNAVYQPHYDALLRSGLYDEAVRAGLLLSHEEVAAEFSDTARGYKLIRPEMVRFVSYPYEWCFSQLKDAALATLRLAGLALDHGMCLKDASAYNIQFHQGRPVLIDTLSFEAYRPGRPWVAYRQFCQHFLAPLALMSHTDVRLSQLLRAYLDGIPLDLASRLLPLRTRLQPGLALHLHLHARMQARCAGTGAPRRPHALSEAGFRGLLDSLEGLVKGLTWRPRGSEWSDYYRQTNYSDEALRHKEQLVAQFVAAVEPKTVWDLGANTGRFSRIASSQGAQTVAFDVDPLAVEENYLACRGNSETALLPLVLDLGNPSAGRGWASEERLSLLERGPADLALALALIHHLAISNNVPFGQMARFFQRVSRSLVIEFVPKGDSQVQRLLASREDVFADYSQEAFERAFEAHFRIEQARRIEGCERTVYFMHRRSA